MRGFRRERSAVVGPMIAQRRVACKVAAAPFVVTGFSQSESRATVLGCATAGAVFGRRGYPSGPHERGHYEPLVGLTRATAGRYGGESVRGSLPVVISRVRMYSGVRTS